MTCANCGTEMHYSSVWKAHPVTTEHKPTFRTFSLFCRVRLSITRTEQKRITLEPHVCPKCGEVRLKMSPLDLAAYKRVCNIE